jgi:hypothetical protein
VLLWAMISGITLPLAVCWCSGDDFGIPTGWLNGLGFVCPAWVLFCVGGCVVLGGVLVLPSWTEAENCCRGLVSPECHQVLVGVALGIAGICWLIVGPCVILWKALSGEPTDAEVVGVVAGTVAAVLTAGAGSLMWLRRTSLPLIGAACMAHFLAMTIVLSAGSDAAFNWQVNSILAVVVSGLVVGTTWFCERFGREDPAGSVALFGVAGVCGLAALPLLPTTLGGPTVAGTHQSLLTFQLVGAAIVVAWTVLTSGVVFCIIRWKLLLKTGEAEDQPEDRRD